METTEMVCIRCPMGCHLTVRTEGNQVKVTGQTCKRGEQYGIQETLSPMRTVTSSVRADNGVRPLVSVKTSCDIPKSSIPAVLSAISRLRVKAPIHTGDVLLTGIAGTDASLIATANLRTAAQ